MRACAWSTSTSGMHSARISVCARSTGAYCSASVLRTVVGRGGSRVGTARSESGVGDARHAHLGASLVARPSTANVTGSVWLVHRGERRVFGDRHARHARQLTERVLHPLADEARELLT